MAINFDAIPDKNPSGAIDPGTYKFKVTKAEMKQPKDLAKPLYLEVAMNMTGMDGKGGSFTDKFFESDSSFLLFKLKRFVQSMGVQLTGGVELKDIAKLVVGKEGVAVINHGENTYKGVTKMEAQIDLFNSDCYYHIDEWAKFCADAGVSADAPVETQEDTAGTQAPTTTDY